jgi:hypothetical protein
MCYIIGTRRWFMNRLPRRKCKKCEREKPLSKTHFESNGYKGFRHTCRSCRRKDYQDWYNGKPKSENALRARVWRQANPDRERFNNIKHKAKRRGKSFSITLKEYREHFYNKECHYCGEESSGGIDRVDNSIGYELDNCVPCCSWCNSIKMEHSKEEMLEHLNKIIERLD